MPRCTVLAGVIGVVLTVLGGVWALQGVGILGGSFMTGSRAWVVIGGIVAVAGLALAVTKGRALARTLRNRPTEPTPQA